MPSEPGEVREHSRKQLHRRMQSAFKRSDRPAGSINKRKGCHRLGDGELLCCISASLQPPPEQPTGSAQRDHGDQAKGDSLVYDLGRADVLQENAFHDDQEIA